MGDKKTTEVTTGADIAKHAGATAVVRGTYVGVDVRKAKTDPPVYDGHAGIKLSDGTIVLLLPPGHADAKRGKDERDELRDAKAVAEGTLHPTCPGSGGGASLQIPCLSPLLYVADPELHELLHKK